MSSARLGAAVGVSQQQICRYELAADRLSAAMLVRICAALGTSVASVCQDAEGLAGIEVARPAGAKRVGTAARLAEDFTAIREPGVRSQVARLISSLATANAAGAAED